MPEEKGKIQIIQKAKLAYLCFSFVSDAIGRVNKPQLMVENPCFCRKILASQNKTAYKTNLSRSVHILYVSLIEKRSMFGDGRVLAEKKLQLLSQTN